MDISQYGSMFIQLPERYFSAGQQVDGTVLLNLLKPVPSAKCLNLVFAGTETVRLTLSHVVKRELIRKGKWKNLYEYENFDQKHQICLYQLPLYHFPEERIEAGMYTFPFTFMLPKDIPSTFEHKGKSSSYPFYRGFGKVEYSLLATIESADPNTPEIKYLQAFTVNQPAEILPDMQIGGATISAENTGCLGKSGACKVTCYFEKNEYCPGETAIMCLDVDNSRCKDAVQSVAVAIKKEIYLHVGSKVFRWSAVLQYHFACERVAPGEIRPNLKVALPLNGDKEKGTGHPTSSGTLIHHHYYAIVKLNLEKPACGEGSQQQTPIQVIVRNPDPKIIKPQLPPDWEPRIFAVAQFQLSPTYSLPILPPQMDIVLPILEESFDEEEQADETFGRIPIN